MVKIGIDLSTTSTGFCVFNEGLCRFSKTVNIWDSDHILRAKKVNDFALALKILVEEITGIIHYLPIVEKEKINVEIGIELANFKNAGLTSRFNLLCGSLISSIYNWHKDNPNLNLKIKVFNSNQWQKLIGCGAHEERAERKMRARKFSLSKGFWNAMVVEDDITDAFCIAYLLEKLDDVTTTAKNTKEKRAREKANYKQQMRAKLNSAKRSSVLKEKIQRYELLLASGKHLTKAQQSALNKLKKEL